MKKLSVFIIFIFLIQILFTVSVGYTRFDGVTLYCPDGSLLVVSHDDVDGYIENGWYAYPVVNVYAPDGRTLIIEKSKSDEYLDVGWYLVEVMNVYAPDGRSLVIEKNKEEDYLNVGWYTEPVTNVYVPDGRYETIPLANKQTFLDSGWYEDPVMYVYARDGRSLVIKTSELESYKGVGWYDDIDRISSFMISSSGNRERVFADFYSYYYSLGYRFESNPNLNPEKPMIALTFDDGPSIYTPGVVQCLKSYGVRATFFCVGQNAVKNPSAVRLIFESAMEIGSHTYNHPRLTDLTDAEIERELTDAANAIYNAAGIYPEVLRPPYGSADERVAAVVEYPLIHWSIDTRDWETKDAQKTYDSVVGYVKDGDIILMHDIYETTLEAVEMLVPKLHEMGYQMVTVSELARFKDVSLQTGVKYYSIR